LQQTGLVPSKCGHTSVKFITESVLNKGVGAKYTICGLLILEGIGPGAGQFVVSIG
jgi:hypothetical protein